MKKVHISILHRGYDDWDIIGIFNTKKKAENASQKQYLKHKIYQEWNADKVKDRYIKELTIGKTYDIDD